MELDFDEAVAAKQVSAIAEEPGQAAVDHHEIEAGRRDGDDRRSDLNGFAERG